MRILTEYTAKSLLSKSKKDMPSRISKRKDSGNKFELYRVGMSELQSTDDLFLYFKVNDYISAVRFIDYKKFLKKYMQQSNFDKKMTQYIIASIRQAIKKCHIQVKCECPDFKYRLAYTATMKDFGLDTNETRPSKKTNPDKKGALCKHLVRILNAPSDWIPYVVPAIRSYIKYQRKLEEE